MKRILVFYLLIFCAASNAFSQQDSIANNNVVHKDDIQLSLQQSIDFALKNNPNYINAQLDVKKAKANVGEVRAYKLPQIAGDLTLADNPELQRMFLTEQSAAMFSGGQPGQRPEGGAKQGNVVSIPNFFQLRSMGDAKLTATQLIFDGSYLVSVKASKAFMDLSYKALEQSKIETTQNVTKAYYQVLINQEGVDAMNSSLARIDTTLKQTRASYENGFMEKIDVDRLEVAKNNLSTQKVQYENAVEIFKMLLKFQMGMPINQAIHLTDSLGSIKVDTAFVTSSNHTQRVDYRVLETQRNLLGLDLKAAQYSRLPSLAVFANLGYNKMDDDFSDLFKYEWFRYNMIGAKLSVPIFDGLGRRYKIQQAKLEVQKMDNTLGMVRNSIDMQVQQTAIGVNNALRTLDIQKRNLDLAMEVARVVKIKYQEGVGSNLEVITAEDDLRTAQTNYYNALYDALVAQIDYKVAQGTFVTQ